MKNNNEQNLRRDFLKKLSITLPVIGGTLAGVSPLTFGQTTKEYPLENPSTFDSGSIDCDLMVYGGSSAGVIAAYTAKMYGLNVYLVEPGRHLGGLSSGGLGKTDTGGEDGYLSGLSQEFYIRIGQYYGQRNPAYKFEPHVAERIFESYIDEAGVEVFYSRRVASVIVKDSKIKSVQLEYSGNTSKDNITINANYFIDATYEGDLMAKAGVSYTVGREGNNAYKEKYNGVIGAGGRLAGPYGKAKKTREWSVDVDPYVVPGKRSSGLLPEINGIGHLPIGSGDKKVQAYNFRLCLTQNKENQISLSPPPEYNPNRYELLKRLQKLEPWESLRDGFIISEMPNGKTDINNYGLVGFSSNYVGKNFDYPEASYMGRAKYLNDHIEYHKGLLWFLATDENVPPHIRKEMNSWGYCRDEFLDTGGWPHQLYVREARRMVSDFVMTEHVCTGAQPVEDAIAMGRYNLDSHVVQRIVIDDHVENEGNTSISLPGPYPISYRSIIPKREEVENLLVPICLSASHGAYGSLRMEPVFMALGQVAGVASYLAASKDEKLYDVTADGIRRELHQNPLPGRKVPREYSEIIPFKKL